jgi:putative FmdB family regulatory protein
MPTYVYECAKCGDEFELYQSFTDDPLKKHPGCGGKVAKVFQPVGIVLKGSGFYKNDSRSGGAKRSKTDALNESSKSDKKTDSSSSGDSSSSKSNGAKSDTGSSEKSSSDKSSSDKGSSDKKTSTPAAKST